MDVQLLSQSRSAQQWIGSWVSAQQEACEPSQLPKQSFQKATLREVVHLSLGGPQIRLKLSNLFGREPLVIRSVVVARAKPGATGEVEKESRIRVRFNGATGVSISAGTEVTSDAISLPTEPFSNLAV